MRTTVASAPHVRKVGLATTIVSVGVIGWATLLPDSNPPLASHWCLVCGSQGGVDALLNILLFVPLGCGLALAGVRARYAVPAMFAFSVLIECSQLVLIAGRDATLGDVITNTIGGALGFAIAQHFPALWRPSPKAAVGLVVSGSVLWLALQTLSSFGFALAIPSAKYYGQIARRLGNFEQFQGRVLDASIGSSVIPDRRIENSSAIERELQANASVSTIVIPDGPTSRIAPIVRVVDEKQNEVTLMGQRGRDAVFSVRTGASVLRLRPPLFGLADAFQTVDQNPSHVDTAIVITRYSPAVGVYMSASTNRESHIPVSPSLGWAIVAPAQWIIEDSSGETVLSAIWVAWLLVPLGYWLVRATEGSASPTRDRILAVLWTAAVLSFGLAAIPTMFDVGLATRLDWASALVGVLVGAWLERAFGEPNEA